MTATHITLLCTLDTILYTLLPIHCKLHTKLWEWAAKYWKGCKGHDKALPSNYLASDEVVGGILKNMVLLHFPFHYCKMKWMCYPNNRSFHALEKFPKSKAILSVWHTVSLSHTSNQAEVRTLNNIERGAQAQVQHYQCSQQGLAWCMGHWN